VKGLRPKTRTISRPAATLLMVAFSISVIGMAHAFLTLFFPERFSDGGVIGLSTAVLSVAGVVALVTIASRRRRA
jgi:hypothetical protein